MKLTYLGCGKDSTKESDLACHLLDVNHSCVLLECPLDLSALAFFLPAPLSSQSILQSRQEVTLHGTVGRKRKGNRDVHRGVLLKPSASTKRVRLSNEEREDDGGVENGRDKGGEHKGVSSLFKEIHGQVLANGAPWYKVAGLELVDVGLLDAVIISNPSGMLGLPFLTKHPDFCGKVYATKATAEIGRMMMEELVLMHADFIQGHERLKTGQKPPWLDPSILGTLPEHMRGSSLGRCFSSRADWQPLYSAQDIGNCFVHVKKMRFGEEVNINGSLRVSPSSSGMGIGASNWVLSGARQSVGYVAASLATNNHAMPLDKAPLAGCRAVIISDVEFSSEAVVAEKATSSREDLVVKVQEIPDCGVSGTEYGRPLRQSSSGSGSSQRPTRRASGSFSSVALARGGVPSSSAGVAKSGTVGLPIGTGVIEKAGKSGSGDLDGPLRGGVTTSNSVPEVASACRGAIEAIRRGGSVLFPVSPSGLLLELLDELGVQLAAANLKHIPIHYISTAAEEMLAYCNTVPEWLCSTRQEKGESLFGYVDLVQEKRLRHSKAFSSTELQKVWQEPCVVFAAHFSLRMGPAAHFLHRWRQNPLCLLVLTEGESDKDLLLAPYMPLSMQVLELRASLRLRSKEVASLLQTIQPQVALVPDFLQKSLEGVGSPNTKVILGYKKGRSLRVPNFETELEVDMSAELALHVQPKLVKSNKVAAAPFQADFCFRDGKLSLQTPTASGLSSDVGVRSHTYQYRWGQVNVGALSRALQERGIGDVSFRDPVVDESSSGREGHASDRKSLMVEIRSPSRAWIELGPSSSHIKANEPSLRHLIADAVNSVLQVM